MYHFAITLTATNRHIARTSLHDTLVERSKIYAICRVYRDAGTNHYCIKRNKTVKIFIVYTHPSEDSFTSHVRDAFIKGLDQAGHSYEISDLYKMGFNSDISEAEYLREANYQIDLPIPDDIAIEQDKINRCDIIVFIYPIFWTDVPSKLKGWFDRVWTYGFAYGNRTMKKLSKAVIICISGHTIDNITKYGHLESMKTVMIGDRIFDRALESKMIVFDGMSKANPDKRNTNWDIHLKNACELGYNI